MMQFEDKMLQFSLNLCSTAGMGVVGAGAPSCFEPGWCMSFVTSHVGKHMYFCIHVFVNIASLIVQQCTCTYVKDQCELDNLGIQMGSSKEA